MHTLLKFSAYIDTLNEAVGRIAVWLVLLVVVISAGNAVMRYSIDWSSNGLLEIQWYLFSAIFLLCAGYVLKKNEHIRIDVLFGRYSPRTQNWIDVFGLIVFMLPMVAVTLWFGWDSFVTAWTSNEGSPNPGGLIRWPVRLLLPLGFLLLLLQGVAELIKRLAFLSGQGPNVLDRSGGSSAEEELAAEIKKHHVSAEVADIVRMEHDLALPPNNTAKGDKP